MSELKDYALARLKEHQKSLHPSCPRDFCDCLLMEMEKVPPPCPESWVLGVLRWLVGGG